MRTVINILSGVMLFFVVILAATLVGVRLFGYTPYTVLSSSMEPKFPVGSLIYVQAVEPDSIMVGDPITFVLNEDLLIATHRVVEVDKEQSHFITKGDANESIDGSPVHFKNVLGRVSFSIPYLGYIAHYIGTEQGRYIAIAFVLLLLLLLILPELFSANKKQGEVEVTDKEEHSMVKK